MPLHAAGVMFRSGDKVLLIKRTGYPYALTWAFPGGGIEEGETPEQAAMREVREEIGYVMTTPGERVAEHEGFALYRYDVPAPFDVTLNSEHSEAMWAEVDNLPSPLHPGVKEMVHPQSTGMDRAPTARKYDGNGWFEVEGNPISKEGVFPYSGRQVGHPDPAKADDIFMVYRPASELSSPECLESFRLLPLINDHTLIGPEFQKLTDSALAAEQKGVEGVIGERVYFENGYLRANLKVFSSRLAQMIAAGKRELSAGYKCRYDAEAGVWNGEPYQYVQREIRGNHLALVDAGRMGPDVAVLDHEHDQFVITCDAKEFATMAQKLKLAAARALVLSALGALAAPATGAAPVALDKAPEHVKLFAALDEAAEKKEGQDEGSLSLEQLSEIIKTYAPQIRELMGALHGEVKEEVEVEGEEGEKPEVQPEAKTEDEGDPTKMDATATDYDKPAMGQDKALRKEVAAIKAAQDSAEAQFLVRAAKRDELARKVAPLIGTFDHASMTLEAVQKYAVAKLGLSAPAGSEGVALDAYLTAAAKVPAVTFRLQAGMDAAPVSGPLSAHFKKEA